MKGMNRYVVVSVLCGLMICVSVIYLFMKPYTYDELNSYINISDSYFDDYTSELIHGKEYSSILEIPTPDKKGIMIHFGNEKSNKLNNESIFNKGMKLELHVKENSSYRIEFIDDGSIVYETEIVESKTVFDYETIGMDFDDVRLSVMAGNSFGIHYIGIIENEQESMINRTLVDSGIIRSQLGDIPTELEEVKEDALIEPYEAIGAVAFYESYKDGVIDIKVLNIHERIITLLGLETRKGKSLTAIDHIKIEQMDMNLIHNSNDLLYADLRLKIDETINIDNLYLRYYISGSTKESVVKLNIFPRYSQKLFNETIVNQVSNIESFDFIEVNDQVITFNKNDVTISKTMFIPEGYILSIHGGQTIDIVNAAYITSQSIVEFNGTKDNQIDVISSDGSGQGIFIKETNADESGKQSFLNYTNFNGLDTPSSGAFVLTGAVTFYQSDVTITNSQFLNNRSEDSLNIVSSHFEIESCTFENAPSDCLDGDFSQGSITNSTFTNIDGDAIDFSASIIEVNNCSMTNIKDKAVSGGEKSTVHINNVDIYDAQIGLASKDSSRVYGHNIYITNTKVAYMLYQKKPEYDGGYMEVTNSEVEDNGGIPYLLQSGSTLFLNNVRIENLERKNQDEIIEKVINGEPIE